MTLCAGNYIVGVDLPEGQYYINIVDPSPSYNASLYIYADKDSYRDGYGSYLKGYNFNFREDPLMLKLDNGRYIHIEGANLLFSQKEIPEDMYYQYEPPEGTLVPAGKYIVGVDIPEGDYIFAPATSTAGLFIIYESEEDAEKALKNNEVYYWTLSKNIEVKNREAYMLAVYKDDSTHSVPLREGEAVVITSTDAIMKKVEKAKLSFD